MTAARLPWMKWYSRDALGDPMLRMIGPEARGVWYDMLWLMDTSARRGYLEMGGKPWMDEDLCRVLAVNQPELERARQRLLAARVPSIEPETGIWFNRRMVRDEQKRQTGHLSGLKGGGNPSLHSSYENQKLDTRGQMPEARTPIKETFIGRDKGNRNSSAKPRYRSFDVLESDEIIGWIQCTKPRSELEKKVCRMDDADGWVFPITKRKSEEWHEAYPKVLIEETLKEIRQRIRDTGKYRKTPPGVYAMVGRWMQNEQNKA
jgi:hypothetical protein